MMIQKTLALAAFSLFAVALPATAQSVDEGAKMVRYERYETAKRILTPLAATDPRAAYYLGLAELGLENKAAAEAAFRRFPEEPTTMAGLARLAFMNGNRAEGERLVKAVADKAKKKDVEPLRFAADAWNYSGAGPTQAVELYNKVLERGDDNAVRVALGDAYSKINGGAGNAMSNYQKVVAADPKNSLAYSRMGAIWYQTRVRYDSALANYGRAKEADPENPLPYRDLANAYFYVGKYDLAKQNADRYYELSDKTTEDKIQKANLEFLTKNYDAAIGQMQELINTPARKPYMYRVIGYSQYEKANYEAAAASLRTFFATSEPAKILPSDYLYFGLAQLRMKQTDSAEASLNKALALDTARNKSETYRKIAEGMKEAKDYARSAEWYGRLVNDPAAQSTATDHFWYGVMYYYGKNYDRAAQVFAQMEQKYPEIALATYWRGRVGAAQDQEGKTGAAVEHYTKWLASPNTETYTKKDPDLMQAYQYLALYYYNKNDKAKTDQYLGLITAIEPGNSMVKQIRDAQAKAGARK